MSKGTQWLGDKFAAALGFALLLALAACSVNVKKGENGDDKKVDIETPLGGIHVREDASARDTGLTVYPGAHPKEKSGPNQEKNAKVNISAGGFGLRVVAIEYVSDDPPEKVAAYYRDQLKSFGTILECHTSERHGDAGDFGAHLPRGPDKKDSNQLSCEQDSGPTLELKVGTKPNQHIVSISPQDKGKGTDFALVFVQIHGVGDKDAI
jgi:hypothetical protein